MCKVWIGEGWFRVSLDGSGRGRTVVRGKAGVKEERGRMCWDVFLFWLLLSSYHTDHTLIESCAQIANIEYHIKFKTLQARLSCSVCDMSHREFQIPALWSFAHRFLLLLLRVALRLLESAFPNVHMHIPIYLDDSGRSLSQESREEPVHQTMTPVRCAGVSHALCTSTSSDLA